MVNVTVGQACWSLSSDRTVLISGAVMLTLVALQKKGWDKIQTTATLILLHNNRRRILPEKIPMDVMAGSYSLLWYM